VEVVTWFGSQYDTGSRYEWYFFQREGGLFEWEVCIAKSPEEGVSIRFKQGSFRKCSDEYKMPE
ncbi:MAG: hypothetical protein K2M91_00305, partial [Lachnospiraceae bacterium]|nr:hypothetical protein [Lachnospiraceae bacterium]